jgi:pimeloyl-ACP methyl ester carboxylesterase
VIFGSSDPSPGTNARNHRLKVVFLFLFLSRLPEHGGNLTVRCRKVKARLYGELPINCVWLRSGVRSLTSVFPRRSLGDGSMRKLFALLAAFAALAALGAQPPASQPNVAGTWQASLPVTPEGVRMVVRIRRVKAGDWNATMYVGDANSIPIDSVTVGRSTIEFSGNAGRYRGEISPDGTTVHGIWVRGNPRPILSPMTLELHRATWETTGSLPADPSPHTARYVTVDQDASLEVLDWGGSGRPVVLLAGLGNNAHVFDLFAPRLTPNYHVYGITRRGFGNSSAPLTGYSGDRLGDDVLAVLDILHLDRPILVGHSIAGEELSSVGSRHPQRVAGLIYLDAGYPYAYYNASVGTDLRVTIDVDELERKLDQLRFGKQPADPRALIQDLLNTELPGFTQSLLAWQQALQSTHVALGTARAPPDQGPPPIAQDVMAGLQRYTNIPVPILAIFAAPHELPPSTGNDPAAIAAADATDEATTHPLAQADAFAKGLPSAHVVRLPHASHYVFRSNEADVLREMNAFIGGLPR